MTEGYLITEEDLSCLNDYIEAAINGDESKETVRRLVNQEFGVIRSRPVQSEQSIRQDIPDCPYHKYQCRYEFNDDVIPEKHYCKKDESVIKTIQQHRQDEREKVLDYLDEWVNSGENLTLFKWELREVLRELRKGGSYCRCEGMIFHA